jgi:TonB-dependent receptor
MTNRSFTLRAATALLLGSSALATPAVAGVIVGSVTDSSGTRSLQGAQVTLEGLSRVDEAGIDGGFRFPEVPAGTYTLTARFIGAAPVSQQVQVPATGEVRANLLVGSSAGPRGDEILVVGLGANQANALSRQKAADGVESVLTRDAIGQNPDQNVAEALRRVPGVSIQDDQGEGRFVVIRGLSPELNSVSINGARIPSPEADNRALALDTVPSELVESIEVKKTLTPDMDADNIGGAVEIKTTSAFDRKKDLMAFSLEGSYNHNRDKWSPKGAVDFSKHITDNFGISGGASYYKRKFGTDSVEASDWATSRAGVAYPGEIDYRSYNVTRTRIAGSLSLDWKPSDTTTLYAKGIVSSFRDDEQRSRLRFTFSPEPVSGDATSATFQSGSGSANRVRVRREMKDRTEIQNVYNLVTGGKTVSGPWTLEYSGSYSYSTEIEPDRQDTIFDRRFQNGATALGVTLTGLDTLSPSYSVSNPAAFTNGSDLLSKVETTDGKSVDKEWAGKFDVARDFAMDSGTLQLKAGGKVRLRKKSYNLNFNSYEPNDDITLAGNSRTLPDGYGVVDMNPAVDPQAVRGLFKSNPALFDRNAFDSDIDSAAASYGVKEDIYAGYALARYENAKFLAIGGVRMEHTRNTMHGNDVTTVTQEDEDDQLVVTPLSYKRSYTNWLPSLNLRFTPTHQVTLRAAVSKSLVRPNISDLAPRFTITESLDDQSNEGELGNPNLKPYQSWNFDGSAEYYFARNAVAQVGVFHKEVKNFIFDNRAAAGTVVNGIEFASLIQPVNGDTAKVTGVELNLQAKLDFLPSPFDGLLVSGNYTYNHTRANLYGRSLTLPGSSKNIYNATLGYEKGPVQLRASVSYRSAYLDEVTEDGSADIYNKGRFLLDVSGKLRVAKGVQLTADFINAGSEPYGRYYRGSAASGRRVAQYEEYGWTVKSGIRVTM